MNGKKKFYLLLGIYQVFLFLVVLFSVDGLTSFVAAQTPSSYDYFNSSTTAVLAISAAISVSATVLGSAISIKTVGTAAISALSEREETFFRAFLVVALCEALAIYGLIVAILLWTKIPSPP
ncbi:MAG: ATPase [Candidatus Lokiarchaeota archaeon]|nr:ATPase [Candidatus Lokiarchaeota archaeon]MBD3198638.1 ATPase [Candidatus Lokiarchaeota archaeon]